MMKATTLLVLGLVAAARSSAVPVEDEEKVADPEFLQRQKRVLDLYVGVPNNDFFKNEFTEYDFPVVDFTEPHVVKDFFSSYKIGFLPNDAVFSLNCKHTRWQTVKLFDLFYFAKDFEAFYKAASWARKHVNPVQFTYTYTLALVHREDCQEYVLPPLYEVLPNFFAPQDVVHSLFKDRLLGFNEKKYEYNNTGYEYNFHLGMFGGPLSDDAYNPHLEYKVSYMREDVGLSAFYAMWHVRYPSWFSSMKYNQVHWFREGESFYYLHQQLFARYTLERLANGLPYVEPLYWDKPLKTGYNPRVSHLNGMPFYTRPDNMVPKHFNKHQVHKAKVLEERVYAAVDAGSFWSNKYHNATPFDNMDGVEKLGKMVYGTETLSKDFLGSLWYTVMNALSYAVKTSNDHYYVGGAMSSSLTALRDPAFYNYLNRLVRLFQTLKKRFHPYDEKDLAFPGVVVDDFYIDKLVTYFDHFDYELSNLLPMKEPSEFEKLHFSATQYRLNHQPFHYNVTVTSDKEHKAMVRVFLGPKYDSEEHELTLDQKRMALVELDRFPVDLVAGKNMFMRSSKQSPFFVEDFEGFRHLYHRVENALKSQETFHVTRRHTCGVPERFQLPMGERDGHPYSFYVMVNEDRQKLEKQNTKFYPTCGMPSLYDHRPFGFPFDRPLHEFEFHVPNFYHKDVLVFHRTEREVNHPE